MATRPIYKIIAEFPQLESATAATTVEPIPAAKSATAAATLSVAARFAYPAGDSILAASTTVATTVSVTVPATDSASNLAKFQPEQELAANGTTAKCYQQQFVEFWNECCGGLVAGPSC